MQCFNPYRTEISGFKVPTYFSSKKTNEWDFTQCVYQVGNNSKAFELKAMNTMAINLGPRVQGTIKGKCI